MREFSFNLLFLGIINLYHLSFGNYIHDSIDGISISRDKLEFSVFLKNFNGVLLYCLDANNALLINLAQDNHEKYITIVYNGYLDKFNITNLELGSCFLYSNVFLAISLQIRNKEIRIKCKEKTVSIKLTRNSNTDEIKAYPKPNYDFNIKNKLFLWMGNIGEYVGLNSLHYLPLKNQLMGCVDSFLINDKSIRLNNNINDFLNSCDVTYNETWCFGGNCTVEIRKNKMYDCSAQTLNFKHCPIELSAYALLPHSFINIEKKEDINYFRIDWKKSQDIMHSLSLHERYLTFHIDRDNYIVMEIIDLNKEQTMRNISLLASPGEINMLLLYFYKNNSIAIKIYNGVEIKSYIFYMSTKLKIINVGFFQHRNLYYDFNGLMKIEYNANYWQPFSDSYVYTTEVLASKKTSISTEAIIIIIVIIILVSLVTLIVFVILKMKKKSKSNADQNVKFNRSKTPSPNTYEYELPEISPNDKISEDGDNNYEEIRVECDQ